MLYGLASEWPDIDQYVRSYHPQVEKNPADIKRTLACWFALMNFWLANIVQLGVDLYSISFFS